MNNAIVEWDPNSGAALPAYLTDAADELGSNIADRMTVPSLSYEGKTWSVHKDGNKTKMERKNEDGDMEPVSIMRMVVLNYNNDRGRAFYPGLYDPSKASAPDCWSADGKEPDPSAKEKQHPTCNGCPQSIKGSKIQDGKEMIACSSHRMIAIVPSFDLGFDPLRLKIAVTSDYDKEIVEHGWFAFRQYTDFLKSRGITHTGLVVTKVKFDNNVAYPKLLFAIDRVLTQEEIAQVKLAANSPKVGEILKETWTPAGVNGTLKDESDIAADPADVPASQQVIDATPKGDATDPFAVVRADGWVPHPDAPDYHYKGEEVVLNTELLERYAPKAAPVAPPAPVKAPEPEPTLPPHDPIAAAVADGWIKHPDADGYHYKGQEVVADGDLAAKYPSPTAGAAEPSAASSPPAASASSAPDADAATNVPADVQNLLDKWTQ